MPSQLIYGLNAVTAVLKARRRELYKIFTSNPISSKSELMNLAKIAEVALISVSKEAIEHMVPGKVHQGIVVEASEIDIPFITDPAALLTTKHENSLWVVTDKVTDPQNLGAILRAACYLKADGFLLSASTPPLSPAVVKVSSGATEYLDFRKIQKLPNFLKKCKESSSWKLVSTGKGVSLSEASYHISPKDNVILVLGEEGSGVHNNVSSLCDISLKIEGGTHTVESLNVGGAANILIYSLRKLLV